MTKTKHAEQEDAAERARLVIHDLMTHVVIGGLDIPEDLTDRAAEEIRRLKEGIK